MANIASAKKRIRQSAKRRLRNRYKLVTTRNMVRKLEKTTDKVQAVAMLPKVVGALDRLASSGVIHQNNAANKKSRLVRMVNALA